MTYDRESMFQVIKESFSFLINEYGYDLKQESRSSQGCRLLYLGKKAAVSVIFEFREAYVNVVMHRLVDGEIVNDPYPYKDDVKLNNIGLDFVVKLLNESRLAAPLYEPRSEYYQKDNAFEMMVQKVSGNLREFGAGPLTGDFSVFDRVDGFVKKHYASTS